MSYDTFVDDIEREAGPHPGKGFSLDRINNDGNYEPGNVRWATKKQQQRNRRISAFVEWSGKRWNLAELCEELELPFGTIHDRIKKQGWKLDEALSMPKYHTYRPFFIMDGKFPPDFAPTHYPEPPNPTGFNIVRETEPMSAEIIDRVADAIRNVVIKTGIDPEPMTLDEHLSIDEADVDIIAIALAKAAIAALRGPTEGQIDAFWAEYPKSGGPVPLFNAMIDEALR